MSAFQVWQEHFFSDRAKVTAFRLSLSEARFSRYLSAANGDEMAAAKLYAWNGRLSQSLYLPLQTWEIALRNRINEFLCWKYNQNWPSDTDRAVRQLASPEARKLRAAVNRQEQRREITKASTDDIVADLSAGFWVGLLTKSYEIPFSWRNNLIRIFPNDKALTREIAAGECNEMLDLRNRIAHHEPIFHLALQGRHNVLMRLLSAMHGISHDYTLVSCNFQEIWQNTPCKLPLM